MSMNGLTVLPTNLPLCIGNYSQQIIINLRGYDTTERYNSISTSEIMFSTRFALPGKYIVKRVDRIRRNLLAHHGFRLYHRN